MKILVLLLTANLLVCLVGLAEESGHTWFKSRKLGDADTAAITSINPAQLIKAFTAKPDNFPSSGGWVVSIDPEGQFGKLHVPSQVILPDPTEVRSQFYNPSETDKSFLENRRELAWVDTKWERHLVQVEPGLVGVNFVSYRNLSHWHLKYGQRGSAWDADVIIGLQLMSKNTAAAETCWAKAMASGYRPDRLSYLAAMLIAVANGDSNTAERAALALGPLKEPLMVKDLPISHEDWAALAAVTGNSQHYQEMLDAWGTKRSSGSYRGERLAYSLKRMREQEQDETTPELANGSTLAEGLKRVPILRKTKRNGSAGNISPIYQGAAADEGELDPPPLNVNCSSPTDRVTFIQLALPKQAENLELTMAFRFQVSEPEKSNQSDRDVRLELGGIVKGKPRSATEEYERYFGCSVGFQYDLKSNVIQGCYAAAAIGDAPFIVSRSADDVAFAKRTYLPIIDPSADAVHTMSLVRVGSQVEYLLDGRRVCLSRMPPPSKLHPLELHISIVGTEITVQRFALNQLLPR